MTLLPLVVVLAAGVLLAVGLDLVRPVPRELMIGLGPAYLLGTAATSIIALLLLLAGVGVLAAFLIGAGAVATTGGALARRHHPKRRDVSAPPVQVAIWLAIAVLVVWAALGGIVAANHPLSLWDSWAIWGRKAVDLYYTGRLDAGFFTNPAYGAMHPDYPLLLPFLEAVDMKLGASANGTGGALFPWSIFIAYAWTVVFVGSRILGASVPAIAAIALLAVPGGYEQALNGNADLPMAAFLGAGALLIGCWLRTNVPGYLVAAAILLAAAASTKNEGMMGAFVVLGAALVAAGPAVGTPRRHVLAAFAFVALTVLPWRIWIMHHGIHGDVEFADGLSPGYLAGRLDRAGISARHLAGYLFGSRWTALVPIAIALAVVGSAARTTRRLALFHITAAAGFFAVLVWIYWISKNDIRWYLTTSGARTVTAIAFIALSGIVHLSPSSRPVAHRLRRARGVGARSS